MSERKTMSEEFIGFFENIDAFLGSYSIGDIPLSRLTLAALIFVAVLFLRKLFTLIVVRAAFTLVGKTETRHDDNVVRALEHPLRFAFIILGAYAALEVLPLTTGAEQLARSVIGSLITFCIFWTIYRLIEPLSFFFNHLSHTFGTSVTEDLKQFFVRVFKTVVAIIGLATILQEWGVNVAALLGGLGLAGMAVALAAKDTVSNLFGGFTIFADKTFRKGDWIETPFVEGTVESIGIRATKIRSFAKALITVPNAKLADASLVNWSRMTNRRVKMNIGLEYRTTGEQLERIIARLRDYLANHPDIAQGVTQMVHAVNFGESSIDINLYYFTKTTDWLAWRNVVNDNIVDFKKIVESEGAGFAFPSRSVYMEETPA